MTALVCALTLAVSIAPRVPAMTRPVVHVRAMRSVASRVPFVGGFLPSKTQMAIGSGVIVDPRGLVLTNDHIVAGAVLVQVKLDDDRELMAQVVGRDPQLDLALLQVRSKSKLPYARLGSSSRIRVGDPVVAVGNPFGLDHTVTSGILSARGRVLHRVGPLAPLLQTDAPINPGSSGGPLYDLEGRVIGVNTAIVEGANGIGFAVPIDIVKRVLPQLASDGHVTRGFAGIKLAPAPPPHHGALVMAVDPDGPGANAGLHEGDVITRWGGDTVDSADVLPCLIQLSRPGTRVRVGIRRADGSSTERFIEMRLLAPER
jgi:serine protease Do